MAGRIRADIDQIADCYEHLWPAFSSTEQGDVINETLIQPAAVLQYSGIATQKSKQPPFAEDLGAGYDGRRLGTFARQRTGLKRIQDDVCGVYRDEHSRPFAVKTKSQIALHLFSESSADQEDVDETDAADEAVPPIRVITPAATPRPQLAAALRESVLSPVPPIHSSPSNSITLPPAVSSAQLSPKHGVGVKPTNFLAKLMNRSSTGAASSSSCGDDDQQRLVDDDPLPTILAASSQHPSSSLGGELSFSSADDDNDDDKHNFNELNALLATDITGGGGHSTKLGNNRRRDSQRVNDDDALVSTDGVATATYDFLNNW